MSYDAARETEVEVGMAPREAAFGVWQAWGSIACYKNEILLAGIPPMTTTPSTALQFIQ